MHDHSEEPKPSRSWLERLSHALMREPQDREQLLELLRDAEQRELLDAQSLGMIEGVMQVSEMQVRDIMVPRSQMVVVEEEATPTEFLPTVIESGHSRFPVIGDQPDEVVGILLAKDLLPFFAGKQTQAFDMQRLLRPAVFIPDNKRLDVLLQEFRINRNHIAIVVDEYGSVTGLITIEDVLEQIVGEIEDEYDIDEDDALIKKHSDTHYIVKAIAPIADFNEYFNATIDAEQYATVGDYVIDQFGHLPKRGEMITVDPFRFKVLHADNRSIRLLRITTSRKKTG